MRLQETERQLNRDNTLRPSIPAFSAETYEQVHSYFTERDNDKKNIQLLKELLGEKASDLSDLEILGYVTEIQFLVDQWLDQFEIEIFGSTLQELVGTK